MVLPAFRNCRRAKKPDPGSPAAPSFFLCNRMRIWPNLAVYIGKGRNSGPNERDGQHSWRDREPSIAG